MINVRVKNNLAFENYIFIFGTRFIAVENNMDR